MKHIIKLVAPQKRKRLSLAEYKIINPKGFHKLMLTLIKSMVKHQYTK